MSTQRKPDTEVVASRRWSLGPDPTGRGTQYVEAALLYERATRRGWPQRAKYVVQLVHYTESVMWRAGNPLESWRLLRSVMDKGYRRSAKVEAPLVAAFEADDVPRLIPDYCTEFGLPTPAELAN